MKVRAIYAVTRSRLQKQYLYIAEMSLEACILVCFVALNQTANAATVSLRHSLHGLAVAASPRVRLVPPRVIQGKGTVTLVALLGLRYGVLRACHVCASASENGCALIALEHTNFTNTTLTYPLTDKIPTSCFIGRHVPNEKVYIRYIENLKNIYTSLTDIWPTLLSSNFHRSLAALRQLCLLFCLST